MMKFCHTREVWPKMLWIQSRWSRIFNKRQGFDVGYYRAVVDNCIYLKYRSMLLETVISRKVLFYSKKICQKFLLYMSKILF